MTDIEKLYSHLRQNAKILKVMSEVCVVRSYVIRRFFNSKEK